MSRRSINQNLATIGAYDKAWTREKAEAQIAEGWYCWRCARFLKPGEGRIWHDPCDPMYEWHVWCADCCALGQIPTQQRLPLGGSS